MEDIRLLAEEGNPSAPVWQVVLTVIVLVVMFVVLITDRVGTDSVMLTALTIFYIARIIDTKEALAGFSSQGLLTVLVLFVVAEGLNKTGALNWYVAKLLGQPKTVTGAQLRVMVPIAILSGFINDTPLVTITLPIVIQWARKINLSTRYLLMPLSFAALLGGVCTLIGTSTNLVVAALLQDNYPDEPQFQNMALFEIGQYGVPITLLGIAYVILATPFLLVRGNKQHQSYLQKNDAEDLLLGARLTQWSPRPDAPSNGLVCVTRAAFTSSASNAKPPATSITRLVLNSSFKSETSCTLPDWLKALDTFVLNMDLRL